MHTTNDRPSVATRERHAPLAPRASRVPLDDVLVELTHDDYADRFEADAVNVGVGGLTMRAAILPDVGSRMRCSFHSPADGQHVEAGCEVVWAADSGRYMGEFGLRFTDLDTRSALALRKLVADWSELAVDAEGAYGSDDAHDAYESSERPHHDDEEDAGAEDEEASVSLRLDGVASPLVAELVHGAPDVMVVEQELPFLRIGTGVTAEDGRRGTLHAVDLRLEGEMPRLVLTVAYDADATPAAEARRVDLGIEGVEAYDSGAEYDSESDADSDSDFESDSDAELGCGSEPESDPLDTIPDPPEPEVDAAASDADADVDAMADLAAREAVDEPVSYGDSSEFDAAYRAAPELSLPLDDRDDEDLARLRGRDLVGDVRARLVPMVAAARAYVITLWARLVPAVRAALARVRRAGSDVRAEGVPMLERGASRVLATWRRFLEVFRARAAQGATRRRAQAPRRVQQSRAVPRTGREEEVRAPAVGKRRALLGAVTLGVLALGGYALASGGAEGEAADVAAVEGSPAAGAAGPSPSAYGAPAPSAYGAPAPSAYGAPAPSAYAPQATAYPTSAAAAPAAPAYAAPAPAPVAEPEVPRAMPEPDYAAGPIPSPTYPSIGDTRVPAPAPAAAPAPATSGGGQSFGAASVPDGTPFTLNMSTPIGGLYGEATDWGFVVRIPGSLSLSKASPIAQNHPHVERAAIRNLGDASELTIRFVEGRSPAYRVEARGTRLVVILGR